MDSRLRELARLKRQPSLCISFFGQTRLHLSPLLLADVEAASDEVIMALMASNREWPWWPYDIWRWWWKGAVVDMAAKVELLAASVRASSYPA